MAGERADAILEAAAAWLIERADEFGLDPEGAAEAADDLGRAVAAAAPLLPGGERAERLHTLVGRLRESQDRLWAALEAAQGEVAKLESLLSARPDAERAPQEDRCSICGATCSRDCRTVGEPRPQGDEVETVARVIAAEFGYGGVFDSPHAGTSYGADYWRAIARKAVLAALDARSGADAVKLAVEAAVRRARVSNAPAERIVESVLAEFASGADRPEGSQT